MGGWSPASIKLKGFVVRRGAPCGRPSAHTTSVICGTPGGHKGRPYKFARICKPSNFIEAGDHAMCCSVPPECANYERWHDLVQRRVQRPCYQERSDETHM